MIPIAYHGSVKKGSVCRPPCLKKRKPPPAPCRAVVGGGSACLNAARKEGKERVLCCRAAGALLDVGQLSQLVEDLGVVEGAGELVAARADGVDVDGGAGVGPGGVVHAGLVVQHMAQGGGERLVGAVQLVIALGHVVLAGRAHGHAALISLAELIQLVVGQDQVLVLGV